MDEEATARVEAGAGDGGEAVGTAEESEVAEKGEDDGFFVVDDFGLGALDLALRSEGRDALEEEGIVGSAAGDEERGDVVGVEHLGDLEGDVLDDRAKKVDGLSGGEQGEKLGDEPFLAEALGGGTRIVVELVHLGEGLGEEISATGEKTVAVERKVESASQLIECHIARRYVEGLTRSALGEGDVGESAEVEAGVEMREKELVADGDERCALAAEGDVELPEIEGHWESRLGSDGVAVANLGGEAERRLMEDGVAVGGDEVDLGRMGLEEAQNLTAEVVAELDVGEGVLESRGVLEGGEAGDPLLGIGVGFGGQEGVGDDAGGRGGKIAKRDV